MREVSPAEVYCQIESEGARHGLFPVMQGDRCFVAQHQEFAHVGAVVACMVTEPSIICSVDMAHPLGNIWKSRKTRDEFDAAKVYRAAAKRRKAAQRAELDQRYADRIREMKALERFYGVGEIQEAMADARRRGLIKMGA
jgi:hypothetical protein